MSQHAEPVHSDFIYNLRRSGNIPSKPLAFRSGCYKPKSKKSGRKSSKTSSKAHVDFFLSKIKQWELKIVLFVIEERLGMHTQKIQEMDDGSSCTR